MRGQTCVLHTSVGRMKSWDEDNGSRVEWGEHSYRTTAPPHHRTTAHSPSRSPLFRIAFPSSVGSMYRVGIVQSFYRTNSPPPYVPVASSGVGRPLPHPAQPLLFLSLQVAFFLHTYIHTYIHNEFAQQVYQKPIHMLEVAVLETLSFLSFLSCFFLDISSLPPQLLKPLLLGWQQRASQFCVLVSIGNEYRSECPARQPMYVYIYTTDLEALLFYIHTTRDPYKYTSYQGKYGPQDYDYSVRLNGTVRP